jgi:excisionase family DNA binding protein
VTEEYKFLTVEEVAAYLRLPASTVYRFAQTKVLPGFKVGKHWCFKKRSIDRLFKGALQHWGTPQGKPATPAGKTELAEAASSPAPQSAPFCPKCGVRMVRTAKNGPRAGQPFYGCPNYPRCREVAALPI